MSNEKKENYYSWDKCTWGTHRVNCYPGTCPFKVYSKDGKVVREEISCTYPEFTDPDHTVPDYNPRGCQKGLQHSKAMYGPDRLQYPMKRVGERGSGKWERISWEQAFDEIGAKMADVIIKHGGESIIEDHGTNGVGLCRGGAEATAPALAGLLGAASFDLNLQIGDFNVGQYLTFGQFQHTPGIENWFLADTLIIAGANPVYANVPDIHYILESRYRGATVVSISPDKNPTAGIADHWIPIDWSADSAMWLGVCKILIDNNWVNWDFVKEQSDLPILVRKDDGRFLRQSDLKAKGDAEQFYVVDAKTGKLIDLPKGTLATACDYALEGEWDVKLANGKTIKATTVLSLLKERLKDYTPEKVHKLSGVHPDTLQMLAELVKPPRKVFVFVNWNVGKLYHGDLMERGYAYMLGLTGNLGRPGTGTRGWAAGAEFIAALPVIAGLPDDILKQADPVMGCFLYIMRLFDDYRTQTKMDPTMPPVEAAFGALREFMKDSGILAPPIFYWFYHGGYREVWDKYLEDPNCSKKISQYLEEAVANGWWDGFVHPTKEQHPKALFVSGSNLLRRYRGGMNTFFNALWDKLELIVVADPRWSSTCLFADYVLPAASYYEYADTKYTTPSSRFIVFTDEAVPAVGDSMTDRRIVIGMVRGIEKNLLKRGVEKFKVGDRDVVVKELTWRATGGDNYLDTNEDEERYVDDVYKTMSKLGWATALDGLSEVGLDQLRKDGKAWLTGRPAWHAMVVQNADMIPGEVHTPFKDQVNLKIPYATTTRRIEFYIDHPWFIEADEHLVRYKAPPFIGGKQPRRLTSGHLRWSIHANWVASEEMLKLHRGEPFAFVNQTVAEEKGIKDNDYMKVFNDYGSFKVLAKVSPMVRPDQLVIYHAWEPYMYKDWMPYDGMLPGPPKGIHFAGGYRHFEYTLWNWGPTQVDRQTNCDFEKLVE